MKCVSCQIEINPQWQHAIEQNICPFCGKYIMEEHLKNCLAALSSAMQDMLQYPEQLNDWLFSNHSYIKTDSPNLINYVPTELLQVKKSEKTSIESVKNGPSIQKIKVPNGNGGFKFEEVLVEKLQSTDKTTEFFERAEVLKGTGKTSNKTMKLPDEPEPPKSIAERNQHLKARVAEIKKAGIEIIQESDVANLMKDSDFISTDLQEVSEPSSSDYSSLLTSPDDLLISSSSSLDSNDDDALTNRILANNMRIAQKNNSPQNKDRQDLERMQNTVANNQKKLGSGSFSRSD